MSEGPFGPWAPVPAARGRPGREPWFNAPAPVLMGVASILLPYLVQSRLGEPNAMVDALALVPTGLAASWTHALLNALGLLAFGAAAARWFGPKGGGRFLLFYLACALVSSLGYAMLHWGQATPLVGASGAIYGLMGASARLLDRPGRLAGFGSRTVIAMSLACLAVNGLMALNWIDVGQGALPIAWEAHLVGYAAGLLLIGPFTPRFRRT